MAGDSVTRIAGEYSSPVWGALALAWLAPFLGALAVVSVHDGLLWRAENGRKRPTRPQLTRP